ncbi:hypothetical protein RchiOBHm_Chr5g0034881 [Rosa chinensis]|uniref:Uncharacterized protein n=1 Tax=Rosa chinensis TaxID=74649 RepID=A0A2P6QB45_ROSCH|nr:hypothetical protein RchiOBHm_Chr5g0034881 [Rosa chinensis]
MKKHSLNDNPTDAYYNPLHIKKLVIMLKQNRRKINFILYMLSGASFDCSVGLICMLDLLIYNINDTLISMK